jgi:hypothetical protein
MNSNNPNTSLIETIHVERGIIPTHLCDYLVQEIETREWNPHTWSSSSGENVGSEETKELDVQFCPNELQQLLNPFILQAGDRYFEKFVWFKSNRTQQPITQITDCRFNRYQPGQVMRMHHDHIYSIFDGKRKGIPVLSFILNFNDDYEGADLYFWDDTTFGLGKGDIIIWPSNFLYPHGVSETISGVRYSAVTWGY